jgi:hypothetical protein
MRLFILEIFENIFSNIFFYTMFIYLNFLIKIPNFFTLKKIFFLTGNRKTTNILLLFCAE